MKLVAQHLNVSEIALHFPKGSFNCRSRAVHIIGAGLGASLKCLRLQLAFYWYFTQVAFSPSTLQPSIRHV